jgi:hypothetical protein
MISTPGTLADAWSDEHLHAQTIERRRSFMSGALAAMTLIQSGVPVDRLIAECVQYGRTIGTEVERAQG